jgi:hypothetical protein
MKIKVKESFAMVGVNAEDININELRQMCELDNRIADVLISHKAESKEKKYISDDDLKLMHAILRVFTREYSSTQTSAFDDELKVIEEEERNMEDVEEGE